jgi:hypothetical protein
MHDGRDEHGDGGHYVSLCTEIVLLTKQIFRCFPIATVNKNIDANVPTSIPKYYIFNDIGHRCHGAANLPTFICHREYVLYYNIAQVPITFFTRSIYNLNKILLLG